MSVGDSGDAAARRRRHLTEGIELAMRDLGKTTELRVMRLEYWDFCNEETLKEVFPDGFPGFALEHAAVIETSLMLHYYQDLVHLDLLPMKTVQYSTASDRLWKLWKTSKITV